MTTFLVLNLDGSVDVQKLNKFLYENIIDYQLVVACNQKYKSIANENVVECIFDENAKPDEVINTLIPKCDGEFLILVRKIENNKFGPILEVAKKLKSQNQIIVIKKTNNIFTKFIKKIFYFIVRLLYGYQLFDSTLAVMGFGEIPFSVLKQTENCSTFTKINRWAGVQIEEVECVSPNVKLSEHKWTRFARLGAYVAVFVTVVLLMTLVPTMFEAVIMKLFGWAICLFMVLLTIVDITIVLVSHIIGGNTSKTAELVEILGQQEQVEQQLTVEEQDFDDEQDLDEQELDDEQDLDQKQEEAFELEQQEQAEDKPKNQKHKKLKENKDE